MPIQNTVTVPVYIWVHNYVAIFSNNDLVFQSEQLTMKYLFTIYLDNTE